MPAAPDGAPATRPLTPNEASAIALRTAAIPALVVGVVAAVLGGILKGGTGVLGAVLGAVIAIAFFAAGQYFLGRILSGNPDFALSAGLLLYLVQVLVLFVLIVLLRDATWLDGRVFGITVLAVTVAWLIGAVIASQRAKVLYVETTDVPGQPDSPSSADAAAEAIAREEGR